MKVERDFKTSPHQHRPWYKRLHMVCFTFFQACLRSETRYDLHIYVSLVCTDYSCEPSRTFPTVARIAQPPPPNRFLLQPKSKLHHAVYLPAKIISELTQLCNSCDKNLNPALEIAADRRFSFRSIGWNLFIIIKNIFRSSQGFVFICIFFFFACCINTAQNIWLMTLQKKLLGQQSSN